MTGLQTEVLDFKVCFDNKKKYGFNDCSCHKNTNGNSKFRFSEKATKIWCNFPQSLDITK